MSFSTENRWEELKVSVEATDAESVVKNAILPSAIDNGISWETQIPMSYDITTAYYETTISEQLDGTIVKYKIIA